MDNITQLTDTVYAVKPLHDDACDFRIENNRLIYDHGLFKSFTDGITLPTLINKSIPQWRLIGNAKEVTKEIAENIVPYEIDGRYRMYPNYMATGTKSKYDPSFYLYTALESLSSLLKSKECTDGEIILIEKIK